MSNIYVVINLYNTNAGESVTVWSPIPTFFFITGELYKSAAIKLKQKKDVAPKFKQIEDMQYLSNGLM